jgi:allantoin racemase
MKIRVINPNTTEAFSHKNLLVARAVAAVGTEISTSQPDGGAASIEDHCDEAVAVIGILEEVLKGEKDGMDGYVIACFGDPGVHAAREVARGPVVGMSEAALRAATLVANGFSIVTLPSRTRIHAERVVREAGLAQHCRSIRAIDVPVLEFEDANQQVISALMEECRRALVEDKAESIVLGCAGLGDLVPQLGEALGVPIIEGVGAAVKTVEGLIALGVSTSKIGAYAYPVEKIYSGMFRALSPHDESAQRARPQPPTQTASRD